MELSRLIYISDATCDFSSANLKKLVDRAKINNQRMGITGLLLFSGGHFMQLLEGDWLAISSLYTRISADPRHTNAQQLLHKESDHRLFPDWGMQLVDPDRLHALDRAKIEKTILLLRLKPLDAEAAAMKLMEEFRRQFTEAA
jgi:hypothetical protein